MTKTLTLTALAVMLLTAPAFSQGDIKSDDGHDWMDWTQAERVQYVTGFIVGMFVPYAYMADHADEGYREGALFLEKRLPWDITVGTIIRQVTLFYGKTQRLDAPVAMVLFRYREIFGDSEIYDNDFQDYGGIQL